MASEALEAMDALIESLEARVRPLTDAQLDRPQAGAAWTARETIGHVLITVRKYDERLRALVARHPRGLPPRQGAHKPNLFARMLLKTLPNVARRFKAPKTFDPRRSGLPPTEFTADALIAAHRSLRATGAEVERLHLGPRKFGTPVSPLLRMRAADAVPVQVAHGRRHLAQILRAAGAEV